MVRSPSSGVFTPYETAYIRKYILNHKNRKRKILLWCCGPQTDAYEARKSAMAKCAYSQAVALLTDQHVLPSATVLLSHRPSHGFSDRQLSILPVHNNPSSNSIMANHHAAIALGDEDLTSDLQYHIKLLVLLASCNLGPKLQAVYPTNDILYALLDPSTILPVKLALGKLLIEALRINPDKVEKLVTKRFSKLNMHPLKRVLYIRPLSVVVLGLLGGDRQCIRVPAAATG